MKLYQIEYMLTTARKGSFSKAADELMVSRPAVSKAIKDLEEEFDVEFFTRTTTGIEITETGKIFCERAAELQEILKDISMQMIIAKDREKLNKDRTLNIYMSFNASFVLIDMISEFRKAYPDIHLETGEIDITKRDSLESEYNCDISIGLSFVQKKKNWIYKDLCSCEFVFCCNKDHPLAGRKSVSVQDIKDEPLIELGRHAFKTNQTQMMFLKENLVPNITHYTNQLTMMYKMIEYGIGSSVEPYPSFTGENLVRIPFTNRVLVPIRMWWDPAVPHNSAFRDFMTFLDEYTAAHDLSEISECKNA